MIDLRRALFIAAVVASLLSIGYSEIDVHEGAAATTKGRELDDQMKCICFPCGGPCVYPSPPPPPPPIPVQPYCPPPPRPPTPKPCCGPQPWLPPPAPWWTPQPWSPPWWGPSGKLYPVDPGYISGASRSFAGGWLPLVQALLAWCGLMVVWA